MSPPEERTLLPGARLDLEPSGESPDVSPRALAQRVDATLRLLLSGGEFVRHAPDSLADADRAACENLLLLRGLERQPWPGGEADEAPPRPGRRGLPMPAAASRADLVSGLLDVSESRLRRPWSESALAQQPERSPVLAAGITLLDQLGRPSPQWRERLRQAWLEESTPRDEVVPGRDLELRWSHNLFHETGLAWCATDRARALHADWPAPATRDDARAWTEAIFYLTDFGAVALDLEPAERHELGDRLDSAIVWSVELVDFDLLGGFLLAAVYAGTAGSERWRFGFSVLLATWDQLGGVPDGSVELEGLPFGEARRKLYYAIHHANLLAALLAHEVAVRGVGVRGVQAPPR